MKKIVLSMLVISIIIFSISKSYGATQADINIILDQNKVALKEVPVIRNDRTMIPLRGFFEHIGATVDWNKDTRQAIIQKDDIEILLTVGNNYALVNGKIFKFDTPSQIINDKTFVPIRFVAESMGFFVDWDPKTRSVLIDSREMARKNTIPLIKDLEELNNLMKINFTLNDYISRRRYGTMIRGRNDVMMDMELANSSEAKSEKSSDSASEHSNTNNQVEGVEEADIVVTNGKYIALKSSYNTLILVETDKGKQKIIFENPINDGINEMYITNNRLVVISDKYPKTIENGWFSNQNTNIKVYDLSILQNQKIPVPIIDKDYEGSYKTSRLIGNYLYMVNSKVFPFYGDGIEIDGLLPRQYDNISKVESKKAVNQLYYLPGYISPSVTNLISLNINDGSSNFDSYLGYCDGVYASKDNIYLTQHKYIYSIDREADLYLPHYKRKTNIYKFSIADGKITYQTEGDVDGTALNQFSMDEYKGDFRIATSTGNMWDGNNKSKNHLFILNKELKVISSVKDLAEGETIYSVRFNGDRVYMVTFKRVDPLFVIDASDRLNPKAVGKLKIPGFSTYMHLLGDRYILGFGQDAYEENERTTVGGFKISLFDVSDPKNPKEKQSEIIGTKGTYSELKDNHKALMISQRKGIFAFPIRVCKEKPYVESFNGAYVYDLSKSDFKFRGAIDNIPNTPETDSEVSIKDKKSKGFYAYDYKVKRIIYIGNYLYTISDRNIVCTEMNTMKEISRLSFNPANLELSKPPYRIPIEPFMPEK